MLRSIGNGLTLLLLLIMLVLSLVIYQQWRTYHGFDPEQYADQSAVDPATPASGYVLENIMIDQPSKNAFNEILERPLFIEGRQPEAEEVVAQAAPVVANVKMSLEGVALSPESNVALLRDLSGNELIRLAEGMKYKGYQVDEVQHDRVKLSRNEEVIELTMEIDTSAPNSRPTGFTANANRYKHNIKKKP